ncbi:DUF4145 domain-containing protein [Aeromonas veronii]|uniref:DUF4145 domain-containing protein n=1 Tax=Aeromonas TaxID=642 RepID=UPI00191F6970|nr:DUF4145 domain-containing protein [Aeromonas veronii]MBL0621263.1 DUF4145 domain-containing protein [Aeromonas veronii]
MNESLFYINQRYREPLYLNSKTKIKCPHCKNSILTLKRDDVRFHEINISKNNHHEIWFESEHTIFQFTAFLTCPLCSDFTIATGHGSYDEYHDYEQNIHECSEIFHPEYFIPTVHIFDLPSKCPKEVSFHIESSFKLAWADESAAGNKIRIAIEFLVETLIGKSKKRLDDRIRSLDGEHEKIKEYLLAIKWLGNDASHDASLKEHDLAFAYKILEQVLNYLYGDRRMLDFLTKKVNENKGRL